MAYRVFISTTNDPQSEAYIRTVKHALWHLDDFPVAPITMEELAQTSENPEFVIRQTLDETDIFIGIYGSTFGTYKQLKVADLIEFEYAYAKERGIATLIFIPEDYDPNDDRLMKFKQTIKTRQIVHTFGSLEELQAQVVVAVNTYRTNARKRLAINPPRTGIAPTTEEQANMIVDATFENDVRRAFDLIESDLEAVIQRTLAVQTARSNLTSPPLTGGAGHEIMVNPIFGEPKQSAQFQADIFMIMPFRPEYDSVYKNVILPTVNDMNLTIKRGDEFSSISGQIMSEVWAAINACRLVIVETSLENANVYYELGIAHTLGKPAILITQGTEIEDFPFDIRHLRFIVYENTIAGGEKLEADLRQSIIWIMNDLKDGG